MGVRHYIFIAPTAIFDHCPISRLTKTPRKVLIYLFFDMIDGHLILKDTNYSANSASIFTILANTLIDIFLDASSVMFINLKISSLPIKCKLLFSAL